MDLKQQLKEIKIEDSLEKLKWIDTHAHYYVKQFNKDRNELLETLKNKLEIIINCGTNNKSNNQVLELTKKYDYCYGVVGYFPSDVLELENTQNPFENLEKLCKQQKILAIGEIGLDYHWNSVGFGEKIIKGSKAIELQKKWFIKQIEFANKMHLPICVHSRDAEKDTLEILTKHKPLYGCVIHCYSYGIESVKKYIDMGFYFGIGGTSTYKSNKELRDSIKLMPIEQILLETDAPYLTPEPCRRNRNDSSYISYVIKNISQIKNINKQDVIKITNNNVRNIYKKLSYNIKN